MSGFNESRKKSIPFCAILHVLAVGEGAVNRGPLGNLIKPESKKTACIWTSLCTHCSTHKAGTAIKDAIHDKVEQLEDERLEQEVLISFLCLRVHLYQYCSVLLVHICPIKAWQFSLVLRIIEPLYFKSVHWAGEYFQEQFRATFTKTYIYIIDRDLVTIEKSSLYTECKISWWL